MGPKSAAGVKHGPFSATSEDVGIYWSQAHTLAFERLGFAIKSRAPLTVFTGLDGAGRTTLLRELVSRHKPDMYIGMLSDPDALTASPCAEVLRVLGEPQPTAPEEYHREQLARFLDAAAGAGQLPVLLIDDADRLSDQTLRTVCELMGAGSGDRPEMKLILAGPTELYEWLYRHSQILVGPTFELTAMSENDTAGYVEHFLKAGGLKPGTFDAEAIAEIHRRTGGLPLKINAVCEGCLSQAAEEGVSKIGRGLVRRVVITRGTRGLIHQMESDEMKPNPEPQEMDGIPGLDTTETEQKAAPRTAPEATPTVSVPPPAKAKPKGKTKAAGSKPAPQKPRGESLAGAVKAMKSAPTAPFGPRATKPASITRMGAHESLARPAPDDGILERLRQKMAEVPEAVAPTRPAAATQKRPATTVPKRPAAVAPKPPAATPPTTVTAATLAATFPQPIRRRDRHRRTLLAASAAALVGVAVGAVLWSVPAGLLQDGTDAVKLKAVALFGGAPASDAPPAVPAAQLTPSKADLERVERIRAAVAGVPDDAGAHFRQALEAAGVDGQIAVVSYARAALGGHNRAAYYLGQMFETGESVPVDRSIARAWYKQAGPDVSGAVKLLDGLAAPETEGALAAPIQLFGGQEPSGSVDLVWTSGEGRDPDYFRVELANVEGEIAMTAQPLTVSALRMTVPESASRWRVVAVSEDNAGEAVSPWLPIPKE